MNYKKIYQSIIDRAINRTNIDGYKEKHHILPRCLGGSDDKTNIVALTAKEHFICHLLLTKIYKTGTVEYKKMIKAFNMMMCKDLKSQKRYTSSIYEFYKKRFSEIQSESQLGKNNSNFGSIWIFNISTLQSIKITKNSDIPEGWSKGRITDKQAYFRKLEKNQRLRSEHVNFKNKIHELLCYYANNNISLRQLAKKFNVNKDVYKLFRKYFNDEYVQIEKQKGSVV